MSAEGYERHDYDVVVIGAGGAGLRAAIEASAKGARTALVCKSLLGKAHTVMAEGGIAAALANVWKEDNWKVHFRDTMRGGKLLNNWRMAQIHAQEAPDRVLELEEWGALFDRTADGLILQRDFGGHRYARLAHVGDRTGLEMIRTLQQRAVHKGIDVFMECTIQRLLTDGKRVSGAFGYWRESGKFVLFAANAIVLATGGVGKAWKITSNSWEYTGDGITMALDAGADLIDMEMVQFHPTGMVWPPSVRGLLVTEGVRGDGGTLKNAAGKRFMFDYIPEFFRAETADDEAEADRWYDDKKNNRRTPDLLPRDEVARAINTEVKAGRGTPHGGVYLDIAARRPAEYIKRRLPSMYHQFKELADVDITTSAMFGRRAGEAAAAYAGKNGTPAIDRAELEDAARTMLAPFEAPGTENPYALHGELQDCMQSLVGIIRTKAELEAAIERVGALRERLGRVGVEGNRQFNPGWHLALDLHSLLTISEACARSALMRTESRGGHTREDYPKTDAGWATKNVVTRRRDGRLELGTEPLPAMPEELRRIVEQKDELPQLVEGKA